MNFFFQSTKGEKTTQIVFIEKREFSFHKKRRSNYFTSVCSFYVNIIPVSTIKNGILKMLCSQTDHTLWCKQYYHLSFIVFGFDILFESQKRI